MRPFGKFLWEQNAKLQKWLHPEDYQRAVEDQYQRVVEENKEVRKKLTERRKWKSELYGEGQEVIQEAFSTIKVGYLGKTLQLIIDIEIK